MQKENISWVNPKELKVGENSRFRADSNVGELMESIKQNGILQPIVAREEDKLVICGNRRLVAAKKLDLDEVPVRFLKNITEKKLLILNLMENIQRKDINSLEIGRLCDVMLKNSEFKMNMNELASAIGVSPKRIKICIDVFQKLPPEYRDKVQRMTENRNKKYGILSENIVAAVLNFSKAYKKISQQETKMLLDKILKDNLNIPSIALIGKLYSAGMPFKKALNDLDLYSFLRLDLPVLKTELFAIMKKKKINGKYELMKEIIRENYPNLLI